MQQPRLINTFDAHATDSNHLLDTLKQVKSKPNDKNPSNEMMSYLIEMGFANRARNQRLLDENANNLGKVIELLTVDTTDDSNWFTYRH
jgi:hypothetical protein